MLCEWLRKQWIKHESNKNIFLPSRWLWPLPGFLTIAFYLAELLGCKKEDPWALVRKLEAQLAQEKFFHEKTKTDHQYEVKVKSRYFV